MKTQIKCFAAFILIYFLNFSFAYTQVYTGSEASKLVKGSSYVHVNEQRKTVSFIRLDEKESIASSVNLSWIKDVLKLNENEDYKLLKEDKDKTGFTHYRFRQTYSNITVENGLYYVHSRNGIIVSANGERYAGIKVSVAPSLSLADAYNKAAFYFNSKQLITDNNPIINKPELLILPVKEKYALAYKFDLYSQNPLKRSYLYVDAHNGDVLKEVSRICHGDAIGTAVTMYNGTQTIITDSLAPNSFRLRDYSRGNGIITWDLNNGTNYAAAVDFTDTDNFWNTTTNQDDAANDAHFGAEATYDFYFNYGRNSYDDLGSTINSYVHYSTGFVNAFWDGTQMTYGDGDGTSYTPLTSLEVIGHEITHGVTEYSAGLIYAGESGALNESFSDIFGNTIRFIYSPAAGTWFVGDQIVVPGSGGVPFRNMADPNQFQCADTYGGLWWNNGDVVHYDSGVQNFWYYLLSTGGNGVNDNGDSYLVNGIGLTDASAIAYRNLSVYLTPNSTFADARTFAIQSAIDLFGPCSNQVIQTTNAWYAVGVGGVFSNAVVAGFTAPATYFCVLPATANFNNTSLNATTYDWDFGDGGTSTAANPSHIYSSPGLYTVRLIASGVASCASVDTLEITNFISVTNGGGPLSPACSPVTVNNCCNIGITNFQFNTINKTSGNGSEGYKDYTCSDATTITAGDAVAIQVTTALTAAENVKVFIDYDNDGAFNTGNELVFSSSNITGAHNGVVNTPTTATISTPLRMRVMDDAVNFAIANSCSNLQNGQAEDYTVTFLENTLPPEVDFTSDKQTVNVTGSVNFFDLSIHAPTSWEWQFPGGTPSSSILQNPVITYNTQGVYDVQLKVTNSFGEDSVIKAGYISVVNTVSMCIAPTTTTAHNGILYDSGGPAGNYLDNQNCTFLIQPPCADTVILSFSSFAIEQGWDYFKVYDGTSAAAPMLLNATGTTIPGDVKASSGSMFINFTTDASVVMPGFAANWTTVQFSASAPVAAFTFNDPTPPLNVAVQFTDLSTNSPNAWFWDFGDGNTSTDQNPAHAYNAPGPYTIQLIAYTCNLSDTITQSITVQGAPVYSVDPDSIGVTLNCNDSITIPITIYNTGVGDLVFDIEIDGTGAVTDTSILIIQEASSWGLDMATYVQTTFGITPTVINSSQIAATNFSLYNIIITVGAQSSNYYIDISNNKIKFENYVAAGGILSHQMATFSGTPPVNLAGGSVLTYGNNQNINTGLITTHPLLTGISNPLNGNNANHCYFTTVPPGAQVITETGTGSFPTTLEYTIGNGKVIATGMTWEYLYINAYNSGAMLPNSINYLLSQLQGQANWITVSQDSATTQASDSTIIYVTINSNGLDSGVYTSYLIVATNDPLNPFDSIPVTLTLSGIPCMNYGFSIAPCNGTVTFIDSTANSPTSWLWDFGDGGTSVLQNPVHQYTALGTYNVKLIACNAIGCDSIIETVTITSIVSASFTFSGTMIAGQPVTFTSTSSGATFYLWNFGDGFTSTMPNPVHTYALPGTYIVTLSISGGSCNSLFTDTVVIIPVGIYNPSAEANVSVYPNPVKDEANIDIALLSSKNISIEVFDVAGRLEKTILDDTEVAAGHHRYIFTGVRAGVYFIMVTIDRLPRVIKVVKTN